MIVLIVSLYRWCVYFQVGSRRVVQYSAVYMIVFGVFTKFGALFITIPDPVIGGTFIILFGWYAMIM